MKRRVWLAALLSLPLVLIACRKEQPSPIVGAILAKSGAADFIGLPESEVLTALASDADGPPFQVAIRDSGSEPANSLRLFRSLASDPQVVAIIGPSTSGESLPVAEEADRAHIPLLSLAASKKIVEGVGSRPKPWVFKFAQNDDLAAEGLLRAMLRNGVRSIALLHSDDGFGKSGAEVVRAQVEQSSVLMKHVAAFPAALDTPETFVGALPTGVDALVIWGTAPGPALLLKSLRASGSVLPVYLSHGNASYAFLESAGPASEGAIIVGSKVLLSSASIDPQDSSLEAVLRFQRFWTAHLQGRPSHFGGHARDALEALRATFPKNAGELTSEELRQTIRDNLEKLTRFHGVTGTFNFSDADHAGLDASAFAIYEVKGGAFVPLAK